MKPEQVTPQPESKPEQVLAIATEDPARLKTCLAALKAAGVAYREQPRVDDGEGCGIDRPITVTSVGNHIQLHPEGLMRCETALKLAAWTRNVIVPSLEIARPGETLTALSQASAYVCRKRNGAETGKISEHARGNAVDISGLEFASGKTFAIQPRMKDSSLDGALQRAMTGAACLYFTTVLDPGSDAAHETHLHLDVIERKNGYRLCW